MKLGVVGLPNVGKSTLFNAITKAGAAAANYAFCTIEPNVGVVAVPDERLDKLAALYDSKKITPTTLEFVDIAGLVKGASKGEGLGNKFLSHIREVDAIVHVVRCFDDENIIHVDGSVNPVRDMETINLELVFADLETMDRRIGKAQTMLKADKKYAEDVERLEKMKAWLEEGKPLRSLPVDEEFKAFIDEQFLLTSKPVIYVANTDESGINGNAYTAEVEKEAAKEGAGCVVLCAKLEEDLWEKKYDVVMVNGQKLEFDKNGEWLEVDCKYSTVPETIIPEAIRNYVKQHFPEQKVIKIERDKKEYEVKLTNKLEITFDKKFRAIDIDD